MRPFVATTIAKLPLNPLFPVSYNPIGDALLGIWNRWDGYRYFLLAYSGYSAPSNLANTVFYPLYPMILRALWKLTGLDLIALSLVVSTLTAFFALYMLYRVTEDWFGEPTAKFSLAAMVIYPTALFLVGPYTEGLFLGLTLAAFYLARKDRWLLAGLCAALASLTRGPGALTAFPLAWIAFEKWREKRFAWSLSLIGMGIGAAAPGLAGIGFLLWRQWMGFPSIMILQKVYFGSFAINPLAGLFNGIKDVILHPSVTNVTEGAAIVGWISLYALMIVKRKCIPVEWLIYMGINLLVFVTKANALISPMQSIGRYVLVLFPGFIFIGDWLARLNPRPRSAYIIASASLLMIFCALYAVGFFIG